MADSRDYYEILGVGRDADQAEIKKAFKKLARQYHPDVTGNDPELTEQFKQVGQAYAVLGDPDKRAQYDRFGHVDEQNFGGGNANFDMFGDLGSIFQSIFGGGFPGFGFGGQQASRTNPGPGPQPGQSLMLEVGLTLEEIAEGVDKPVKYQRLTTCSSCFGTGAAEGSKRERCTTCRGQGRVQSTQRTLFGYQTVQSICPTCHGEGETIKNPCEHCQGRGRVEEVVETTVRVPAGVEDGMRVRVRGGGDKGQQGGDDGDLLLQVHQLRHERFQRDGRDLVCEQPISFAQAALGDQVAVDGLLGPAILPLPAGTQTGRTFRLAGYGLPDPRDARLKGDLFVTVRLVTPTKLSAEEKELLFRFAQSRDEHPAEPEEKSFFERLFNRLTGR